MAGLSREPRLPLTMLYTRRQELRKGFAEDIWQMQKSAVSVPVNNRMSIVDGMLDMQPTLPLSTQLTRVDFPAL
jgi:hypothetical protein